MRVPAQISAGAKGFSGSDAAMIKIDNAVSGFLDDCGLAHNKANSLRVVQDDDEIGPGCGGDADLA